MATPMVGVMEASQQPQQQQQQQQQQHAQQQQSAASLPNPPRDHVAPKSYESVTIAVGRNCPPALRRTVWHVTDFDLRKLMYNGAISMVYHAVDKRSGITVALKLYKRIKLNEIERHQVAREIRLHSDLAHDSIIALYAAWKDRAYVYLALEWAPGGDVYSYLKSQRGRLAEELAVPLILEPFMAGLAVIHEKGLIHRDIKPENMLLTNSFQVKIADFGLSIDSKQEIANTRLGTIDYLAPEILDCPVKQHPEDHKDRPDTGYTNKVDCWSVGVLAYELLVGQPPFAAPTANETLRLIRTKKVEYPNWLSPESINFMSIVLIRDPSLRPTIADLLQHPWILKYSRREGGGLARNRGRLQQRRPTLDGGMLVRSVTTDLSSHITPPKHMAFMAGQTQASQAQQQVTAPGGAGGSGDFGSGGGGGGGGGVVSMFPQPPSANGNVVHHSSAPKHVLHHSNTYGHGTGLSYTTGGGGGGGGVVGGSSGQMHSMPLTQMLGTAGGAGAASNAVPGPALAHIQTAPVLVPQDTVMTTASAGGAADGGSGGTATGFASLPATPLAAAAGAAQPSTAFVPLPGVNGAGAAAPPASSPDRSLASFSRKLMFWSMSANSSSAAGGGAPGNSGTNGGAPAPLAWGELSGAPASPNGATRVAVLPPVTPTPPNGGGGGGAAAAAQGIFGRLPFGAGRPRSPASPASPNGGAGGGVAVGATAFLSSPVGGVKSGGGGGALGAYDGGAGGEGCTAASAGSGAVPPVTMDAPASPSGMFRIAKGSSFLRPAA